jgi:cobalt-zinc-cadmium efflux system protein
LAHSHIEEKLGIVFAISAVILLVEIVGGFLSNSLALITDSLHVLLDMTSVGISLIAFRIAKKPHSSRLTFGFHRVEVVAAFVNGMALIVVAVVVFYEAYRRILEPPHVDAGLLLIFAGVGLGANVVMALLLKKESKSNLNIKGSYLHVLGDLLSSVGVIAGAVLMFFVPYPIIDVIVSIGIGILIVRSGLFLCRECIHVFMEGAPNEIKVGNISEELLKLDEVVDVHDVHVWTLTSNMFAMSAHVKIKQDYMLQSNLLLTKINQVMKDKFGINHVTIQLEGEHDLINPNK